MVRIRRISPLAQLPTLGSAEAAGYDLYACLDESIAIPPQKVRKIGTGLIMEIPRGFWGGIYARSGMATKKGLRPANAVGVIDSDYRGEIIVALYNDSNEPQVINPGDKIAQLIFHKVCGIVPDENGNIWDEIDVPSVTERGANGFGSTDNK